MFYENLTPNLRMGDVLEGLVSFFSQMENPFLSNTSNELTLKISHSRFFIILTPCCAIGKESTLGNDTITIAPLVKLIPQFFRNPVLVENFLRINKEMTAEQAMPPNGWLNLRPEERDKRIAEGLQYAFINYFIYAPNELFPVYELTFEGGRQVEVYHYMVDFKNICVIKKTPIRSLEITKRLQLSVSSRNDLREKLSFYFGNPPIEDEVLID